jgi:RNA polymerase sigma-70 factor, ECF subfamily
LPYIIVIKDAFTTLDGNRRLLDRLVSGHLPEAVQFAMRLTGSEETAAEVIQESLYRAVRGIGTFRGQSQFRTWFYQIVVNTFHEQVATKSRKICSAEIADHLPDPQGRDPAAEAMAGELQDIIVQRISQLPTRQREVLVLITYERMRPSEVALVLGISETNVHVNLHHARTRLLAELSPYLTGK